LARTHGWWRSVIGTMQGLSQLYFQTGGRAEWARLVEEIVPNFVDPDTDGPLPGWEEEWGLVTEYRVRLAREARQWAEAERLQRASVERNRQRVALALALSPEVLDAAGRNAIQTLGASLHELGEIQREQGNPDCIKSYQEAMWLAERIGDRPHAAVTAFNLGHVYLGLPARRDLAQAERWYRRSLELRNERDRLGRSQSIDEIGVVYHERFLEAKKSGASNEQLLKYANKAIQAYQQSLDWAPPDAVDKLGLSHQHLGSIYAEMGHLDRAFPHWREAIRYFEVGGNLYEAARTRFVVAVFLAQAGRLADAREYAYAALRNFQTYGGRAAEEVQQTQGLIEMIERDMG
jgi:tetratricopeptide (TPR) repeat protein